MNLSLEGGAFFPLTTPQMPTDYTSKVLLFFLLPGVVYFLFLDTLFDRETYFTLLDFVVQKGCSPQCSVKYLCHEDSTVLVVLLAAVTSRRHRLCTRPCWPMSSPFVVDS